MLGKNVTFTFQEKLANNFSVFFFFNSKIFAPSCLPLPLIWKQLEGKNSWFVFM